MTHHGPHQTDEPRPRLRSGEQGTEPPARRFPTTGYEQYPYGLQQPNGEWAGWERYHKQMFDVSKAANGWIAWKMNSTGVNIARSLVAARNEARDRYVVEHGALQTGWPLPHPPAVLWMPDYARAACLGCYWLRDGDRGEVAAAGAGARAHAREHAGVDEAVERLLAAPIAVSRRPRRSDPPPPVREV